MLLNNYSNFWNISGKLYPLDNLKIMAIINCNSDSFYAESRVNSDINTLKKVEQFINEGANIIDIGGESTRPGAKAVSEDEELARVIPIIKKIRTSFPEILISIDTYKSTVAEAAINAGANIINDISFGMFDEAMFNTCSKLKVPYIGMHTSNFPEKMQQFTKYSDIVTEIIQYLDQRISTARKAGIIDITIDVGFGFGKTLEDNYKLLSRLKEFEILNCPILLGVSRKSMIYKSLNTTPENALNGTTVLHTIGILNGANIIRVHDVKEANDVKLLLQLMK
jgi:dihydropteroate synthase